MVFGRRADTVVAPSPQPAAPSDTADDTIPALERLRAAATSGPDRRQLERDLALLADEIVWLKERFEKLQSRVTSQLREIRREVDRLLELEPVEEEP